MNSSSAGQILDKKGRSLVIVRAVVSSNYNSTSMARAWDAYRERGRSHGVRMDPISTMRSGGTMVFFRVEAFRFFREVGARFQG